MRNGELGVPDGTQTRLDQPYLRCLRPWFSKQQADAHDARPLICGSAAEGLGG